jgi:hypothetical protein
MTKTGWPPPVLMQDDNPQLSRWFATRPDALYTFKRNNMTPSTATTIYYTYHTDPGHGWLEVGIDELDLLGIRSEVSSYSYMNAGKAYLEEDCDMALFMNAMEAKGVNVKLAYINEPTKDSVIRSYRRFT